MRNNIQYNLTKQQILYERLLNAMYSDNADYILEQLSRIYTIIYSNNIKETGVRWLKEED